MSANEIATTVGAVSGLVSFLAVSYLAGYWKSKVDMKLRDMCAHPLPELALMIRTLWDIYIVDALQRRPDLFEHHSAYRINERGKSVIPDGLKQRLGSLKLNGSEPDSWQVVKTIGVEQIAIMADEQNIPIQEAIALLTLYAREEKGGNEH